MNLLINHERVLDANRLAFLEYFSHQLALPQEPSGMIRRLEGSKPVAKSASARLSLEQVSAMSFNGGNGNTSRNVQLDGIQRQSSNSNSKSSTPSNPSPQWFRQTFDNLDINRCGRIPTAIIQAAFTNCGPAWQGLPVNKETIRIFVTMFDLESTGSINFINFCSMWKYLNKWHRKFREVVGPEVTVICQSELMRILHAFDYRFDEPIVARLMKRFDGQRRGYLDFGEFVQMFIQLQTLKLNFRTQDQMMFGMVTISYQQFLQMAMNLSIW